MTVQDIFDFLNEKFPVSTACDFDNVGILAGDPNKEISKVMIALDCTKDVLFAAKEKSCQLILTHHPVIFDPLKSVTADNIVHELIQNQIAVISMHTNLDVGVGGVNDCLCNALALIESKKFICEDGYALNTACLPYSMPADKLAIYLKEHLGGSVKYIGTDHQIHTVMVCSGSGGGYWKEAFLHGCDALITADVKHNIFIDAGNAGFPVFDAGHFHTEDVVVEPLATLLRQQFPDLSVFTDHRFRPKMT